MNGLRLPLLAILVTASMLGVGWGVGRWGKAGPGVKSKAPARGALLFQVHCASCHGAEGRGDGGSAAELRPPPRDFAVRPWRFEATPESIKQVTRDGIPATAMPAFGPTLSDAELDALAAHVHFLATRGPTIIHEPTEEERLLRAAGFSDMRGTDPPPLSVVTANGRPIKLTDLRGKLVILNFWGTGCVHCMKEIPDLRELEKSHGGRIALLNVCADEDDPTTAQKTLDRIAPGATSYSDSSGLGMARFEVQALPSVWLIGPDGKAIGRCSGARDWRAPDLTKLIAHWLPKP